MESGNEGDPKTHVVNFDKTCISPWTTCNVLCTQNCHKRSKFSRIFLTSRCPSAASQNSVAKLMSGMKGNIILELV